MALSSPNAERLRRVKRAIARLPKAEQPLWQRRVRKKLGAFSVGADVDELPANHPARAAARAADQIRNTKPQPQETDLKVANFLDGVYSAVADRTEEVASKGASALSTAGFSLWPLVIAGLGILYIVTQSRKSAA